MADLGPDTTSSDYDAMLPYLIKSQTVLDGADAVRASAELLPRFPRESDEDYEYRRANAKFTNIFRDICENLASKPFAKQLALAKESSGTRIAQLCEDIDGRGNHIHVFAQNTFFTGLAKAVDWILVDYTNVPSGITLADERAIGARPYWVPIPAEKLLAVYSDYVAGKEIITHARILESAIEQDGWGEKEVVRVRVFNRAKLSKDTYDPATFKLYERVESEDSAGKKTQSWDLVDEGDISIEIIPLVPFSTGRRIEGTWQFRPALQDALDLQIEHYHQETDLKMVRQMACYPTLTGNGVDPPVNEDGEPERISRSPGVVLYTPPSLDGKAAGSWSYIEPSGTTLTFGASQVEATEKQLREIGRQPLTAGSGNITVVTSAFASQKSSSAVQMWALALKDVLEQALKITCMWLEEEREPEVEIYTDFAIELETGSAMERLIKMRSNGDLSQETLWQEAQRRGELSAEFDAEEEKKRLLDEAPDPDTQDDLLATQIPQGKLNDEEGPSLTERLPQAA